MERCEHCQAEFRIWEPPANIRENNPELDGVKELLIPTCHCLRDRADRVYDDHLKATRITRAQAAFERLHMGSIDTIPKAVANGELVKEILEASATRQCNVILHGKVGIGKSAVLKSLAYRYILLAGQVVKGGYVPDMLSSFKDMDRVQELYEYLKNGDILVLDDLDKLLGTRFEIEKLLSLVDWYTSKGRPVYVTMNTRPDMLVRKLSDNKYGVDATWANSLIDRLQNNAFIREMVGESFRQPA